LNFNFSQDDSQIILLCSLIPLLCSIKILQNPECASLTLRPESMQQGISRWSIVEFEIGSEKL